MIAVHPFLVLHVCTGNICRSPMAELLMRRQLDATYGDTAATVALDGAGTYAGHAGYGINPPAGRVLADLGIDASSFRAQGLTRSALERADLVLCATNDHVREAVARVPAVAGRVFTLRQFASVASVLDAAGLEPDPDPSLRLAALRDLAPGHPALPGREADIDDPYGQPIDVYRATALQIRAAVRSVVGVPTPEG